MVSTPSEAQEPAEAPAKAEKAGKAAPATGQPAEKPGETSAETSAETPAEAPRKRGRKPGSTARKTRTVELTLTVTGTMDGEWQAELTQSGSRLLQGLAIPAAAVSRAAAELHEDISKTIEGVLDSARQQHQARLAELEAELSKVKEKLANLQDG